MGYSILSLIFMKFGDSEEKTMMLQRLQILTFSCQAQKQTNKH